MEQEKHKHLAQTGIFWAALTVPIALGAGLAGLISFSSENMSLCFTSQCVQTFYNDYKFPIAIMGVSLPLVAMVAAIHRSVEASKQIDMAIRQYGEAIANNRFGNYLKHREGFDKLIDAYCARRYFNDDCKVYVITSSVYASLFPEASFDNVNWNGQYDAKFYARVEKHYVALMSLMSGDPKDFDCGEFLYSLSLLMKSLSINYSRALHVKSVYGENEIRFNVLFDSSDSRALVHALRDVSGIVVLLRGYLGVKDVKRYTVGSNLQKLRKMIEESSESFTIFRSGTNG